MFEGINVAGNVKVVRTERVRPVQQGLLRFFETEENKIES
jgi:preprotein translocase subunit Sec61beta